MRKLPELPEKERTIFKIDLEPEIPQFPEVSRQEVDMRYALLAPYAYAHIYWDENVQELVYYVEEPELTVEERKILNLLEDGIKELINISYLQLKGGESVIEYLEKNLKVMLAELRITLTKDSYLKIMYYIYRDFVGLGKTEPFMNDYFIEDVECNGVGVPIYIVHRKYRNLRTNVVFESTKGLSTFVEKLAQKCGKYISYATPLLDGALPDGSIDYTEPVIYKENGFIKISKIGEFVDKFYEKNQSNKPIKVNNLQIPCFNPKTLKINWKDLDYVYRHKIDEDLYELELEYGRKIKLTGAHSIFTLTKEGVKNIRTENLKENDYAVIPLKIPPQNSVKEINIAKKLSNSKYSKKLVLDNVPPEIYKEKEVEIMGFLKNNYKNPRNTYNEHKRKNILPIKLYNILDENTLRNLKIKTTSPVKLPTYLKIDKEFMKILGLYIAEGWISKTKNHHRTYFCLGAHEENLINELKQAFKNCFNIDISLEPVYNNARKITVNSLILYSFLKEIINISKGAKTKRIPELVFNLDKELQQEFLKYWSLGDYGSTSSDDLANEISYLSLFNNDIATFYKRERESEIGSRKLSSIENYTNFFVRNVDNPYAHMIPAEVFNPLTQTHKNFKNKKISRKRFENTLNEKRYKRFNDLSNLNPKDVNDLKFIKEWSKRGFIENNQLSDKGKDLIKEIQTVKPIINSDLGFAKIKKINRTKSTSNYVYDLSVPGHENFIGGTGGICCHNSRVNATFTEDVSSRGPTFTLRKFTKKPWTPTQLMYLKTISPAMLAYLWLLIEYEKNIMVIGGTGSGKTSLLNGLSFFIPPQARVVSIEDTRELNIEHINWLPAVARSGVGLANLVGQKYGEVSLFNLLKESFRMNPDYVIIGEVRGEEAYVLFQGMASGHPSFGTMHANDIDTMIKRLETPPINLSASLVETMDAVVVMVQSRMDGKPVRRVREIVEIISVTGSKATSNTVFAWNPNTDSYVYNGQSHILRELTTEEGISEQILMNEFSRRTALLSGMFNQGIFEFSLVQKVINAYYKTPKQILNEFGIT